MKKVFYCMALIGMMAFSMTACGSKDGEDVVPTQDVQPTQEAGRPVGDVDFDVEETVWSILERVEGPAVMQGSEYELNELYGIPSDQVESFIICVPMMNVSATELAMFKAASEDAVQTVVDGVNARVQALIAQWETYLPEQLELVQNHKLLVQGRYIFLIVGEDEMSAYAENVFMRKFDPSIEEMVLVRKFRDFQAVIKEKTDEKMVLEYTEEGKVYTFECTYAEYFYAEGGLENFAVGDAVNVTLEEPVPEAEGVMQASLNWIDKNME